MDLRMMLAAAVVVLAGCGGASFSMETEPMGDAVAKTDGDATDADAGESMPQADAAQEATTKTDTGVADTGAPSCTCGDAGSSCFYSVDEPASGYGAPYPVTTVTLTPNKPTATFTATVTTEPQPYHNVVWYDLDLSTFANGGTLYISGQVGDGSCSASSYLMAQCGVVSTAGSFPSTPLESNGGVIDSVWMFPSYPFSAGTTVLHFGTEGGWGDPAGSTNTNKVTVLVQP
jgi:hypothetical protein